MKARLRVATLCLVLSGAVGCPAWELLRYAVLRDAPELRAGESIVLPGLEAPVEIARRADGIWRIRAAGERDAMHAVGYLQARDRMAQLDLLRHLARGELAALLGDRRLGERSALELDVRNRFLGFRERSRHLLASTSDPEREAIEAFAAGVNAWIAEGRLPLEHRLLGVAAVSPWRAVDSLAIYGFIMHGLEGNADREIRRLRIACEAGAAALERIWPQDIEFDDVALPDGDRPRREFPSPPGLVPELVDELPRLCEQAAADRFDVFAATRAPLDSPLPLAALETLASLLGGGLGASNNWAVSGAHTRSGRPVLSNDPHLPHMNPPIVWGMEVIAPGLHVAGFTLPGLHRVVFGHNGRVAFGATTNHVDRQDLVLHRAIGADDDGRAAYEIEGEAVPFELESERFEVRGRGAVDVTVRFTRDGPLLNDIEPELARRVPLVALRRAPILSGHDLDGARLINHATSAAEFAEGIAMLDLGCSSWIYADAAGHIGYRSPCVLPIRTGWRGTFPVPGWIDRYQWRQIVPKELLPAADDPERGWLASANNQIVPSSSWPTTYNNDASSPSRFLRIRDRLLAMMQGGGSIGADGSARIQLDTRDALWGALQRDLQADFCVDAKGDDEPQPTWQARRSLCDWSGEMSADSSTATLYTLWTNAVLDRALADELPGDSGREVWRHAQALPQFEVDVAWLFVQGEEAAVWDDARTLVRERRSDVLRGALDDALALARDRYGADPRAWGWGRVRPLVVAHLFSGGGPLGWLLDSAPMALGGGTETVFKQQFTRADRARMAPVIGPVLRFSVDLAEPWAATYSLAGGQSGWPLSDHYGDLLDDWSTGRGRPLTPPPASSDVIARLVPGSD